MKHDKPLEHLLDACGQDELHREIGGRGLTYREILEIAREIAARRNRREGGAPEH